MKKLHRDDLFGWTEFDCERNLDFHSVLWVRSAGNVAIDPLPLSEHDAAHLEELGGLAAIVVTNKDHLRAGAELARRFEAKLLAPAGEREDFPAECDGWLSEGDEPVPGLRAMALDGSKTAGELCLILEGTTLITGDLIRSHVGGKLCTLPDPKLKDKTAAMESVRRVCALEGIETVLTGDGWPIFRHGGEALLDLGEALSR